MIVHVFTQISDYSNEFVKMLIGQFDPSKHIIIFRKRGKAEDIFHEKADIRFLSERNLLLTQMPALLKNSKKIIFHSFPVSRSLLFWYKYRRYMNKAVWSVWGQDAYWFRYCKKNLPNLFYEFIRTRLIRKLGMIFCPIRGDYEYVVSHYKTPALYVNGMYPIPTDFELLKSLRKSKSQDEFINIQAGNSANPTNNLEELIYYFSKISGKKFRIFCPLSYGDKEYASKIIGLGTKLLGDRFVPLTDFLDRKSYARFIISVDILIMNHQRQQGLGNIFSYLFLGKKVYIRGDNSSFSFFEQNGIKVYNTMDLLNAGNADELLNIDEKTAVLNMSRTETLVSKDVIAKGWKKLFD